MLSVSGQQGERCGAKAASSGRLRSPIDVTQVPCRLAMFSLEFRWSL